MKHDIPAASMLIILYSAQSFAGSSWHKWDKIDGCIESASPEAVISTMKTMGASEVTRDNVLRLGVVVGTTLKPDKTRFGNKAITLYRGKSRCEAAKGKVDNGEEDVDTKRKWGWKR